MIVAKLEAVKVLVLGGTADARALAAELHQREGCHVVSSLAGRTSRPTPVPGAVRIGGFGGAEGLTRYLREEAIDVLIDATHPFADSISEHACLSAQAAGVRLIALRRPRWQAQPGDRWTHVADVAEAARVAAVTAPEDGCVFVTTGRQGLENYAGDSRHRYLIRTIEPPTGALPPRCTVVLDRGPFTVEAETALLAKHNVSTLVTKNSGGGSVAAKLVAARRRAIPVILVDPPALPAVAETVETVAEAMAAAGAGERTASEP